MEHKGTAIIIDDFFRAKKEKFIISEFKKILSEAKKGALKSEVEEITKKEGTFEYNRFVKTKLQNLVNLLNEGCEDKTDVHAELVHSLSLFEGNVEPVKLKEGLPKTINKIRKLLNKEIKALELKSTCNDILSEKHKKDSEGQTRKILAVLAISNSDVERKIQEAKKKAGEKYEPNSWLDDAAEKAKGVVLDVSHISKLTHSSARGSNIKVDIVEPTLDKQILTTHNCARYLPMDFAYSTAEYAPVAQFLQLDCNGELLGKLVCNDISILKSFAKDEAQLKQWQDKFSEALGEKEKSTHTFLKQVYFPVGSNYHLVTPLVSSSMAQIIHDRIWLTRQKNMVAREARNNNLFSDQVDILFHKTAVLKVTQSQPQNVSGLNAKRKGQLILLPAPPPQWKSLLHPPDKTKNCFNRAMGFRAREVFNKLRKLLLAIKFHELSFNLHRKQLIADLITEAADAVFDYVWEVHQLEQNAGWSLKSNLPMHQQFWLDPYRKDKDFQANRTIVDWQTDISNDFAKWVDSQIYHPKLTRGTARVKHWRKLFAPLLREFNAVTDITLEKAIVTEEGKT